MLRIALIFTLLFTLSKITTACSIVYYIDAETGKIFVANNEDYWYDVKDYIQIVPANKNELARLWYGWDKFAQGGINSAGLFFDGAVTPEQKMPKGYTNPNGRNVGDEILAFCSTVDEAIAYFEKEKIAINTGHIMFGDSIGNAVVLEWINGEKQTIKIQNNVLIATNYLLSDTSKGNYPCYRYQSISERIDQLKTATKTVDLRKFGNVIAGAVQIPRAAATGKIGGTLYTSAINITDMEFVLIPKLDNTKTIKLNLLDEFKKTKKQKIKLY